MESGNGSVVEETVLPIVDFSVGKIKDGAKLNFTMYKNNDLTEKKKRKLVCDTPTLRYVGSNYAFDPSRDFVNQYVVICDRETGKRRIFPAENFKLYPVIRRDDDVDSETERIEAMEKTLNESRSFVERLDNLTEVFGSKIKKKAMTARHRNQTSDTTQSVAVSVKKLIASEGMPDRGHIDEVCLSILPYDKDATSEEKVYDLEKFIPSRVRSSVREAAEELISPTAEKTKAWKDEKNPLGCRFISWRASHMHPSVTNDEETTKQYLSCLQLLAYMMKFYAPTGSIAEKRKYKDAISDEWKEWFWATFLPHTPQLSIPRQLPPQVKDKILAYSVILAWHIDSNQFDVQMLAEGFKISERKLSMVIKALGGRIKQVTHEGVKRSIGCLQLPLVFPKVNRRK